MAEKIRVENRYLSHILFNSDDQNLKELFERTPGHVYTESKQRTSLLLLHLLVQKAFNETAPIHFSYDKEKVKKILLKPEFREVQTEMIDEVCRLYQETQKYLECISNKKYTDSSLELYRRLSGYQIEQYFNNCIDPNHTKNEIESNYLTSFHTSDKYNNGIVMITADICKKDILFYDNLVPFNKEDTYSGFSLEGEALIKLHNSRIKYDYAYIDHNSKRLVDLENGFRW